MKLAATSYQRITFLLFLVLVSLFLVAQVSFAGKRSKPYEYGSGHSGVDTQHNEQPPLDRLREPELKRSIRPSPSIEITELSHDELLRRGHFLSYRVVSFEKATKKRARKGLLTYLSHPKRKKHWGDRRGDLVRFSEGSKKVRRGGGGGYTYVHPLTGRQESVPHAFPKETWLGKRAAAYVYLYNPEIARLVRFYRAIEKGDRQTIISLWKEIDRDGRYRRHYKLAVAYAVELDKRDALQTLRSLRKVPKAPDQYQYPKNPQEALTKAIQYRDFSKAKALLSRGAKPNFVGGKSDPLGYAAAVDSPVMVELLISHGAVVDSVDRYGGTALHSAASWDAHAAAEVLIAKGANVNARDKNGRTPLFETGDYSAVAILLIAKGAYVNARDKNGNTVLHGAVLDKRGEKITFLINNGADVNAKNNWGFTPSETAKIFRNDEQADLLMR